MSTRLTVPMTVLDDLPLAFLYPAKTVAWLRRVSGSSVDSWQWRQSVKRLARRERRPYTSNATAVDSNPSINHSYLDDPAALPLQLAPEGGSTTSDAIIQHSITCLLRLLRSHDQANYDEAWRLYNECGRRYGHDVLEYLATSKKQVDADRSKQLFEHLRPDDRGGKDYRHVIAAYLATGEVEKAKALHREALSCDFAQSSGSDMLLHHAVHHRHWGLALETWISYKEYARRVEKESKPAGLWTLLEQSDNLATRALELADFCEAKSSHDGDAGFVRWSLWLSQFTYLVLRNALYHLRTADDAQKVQILLDRIDTLGLDRGLHYNGTILRLYETGFNELSMSTFQKLRKRQAYRPSYAILRIMLKAFCDVQDVHGIQNVLDDIGRFYHPPKFSVFGAVMNVFALRGDAATVERLFSQLRDCYPSTQFSPNVFKPLMHVYARRGELGKAMRLFETMSAEYAVQPDVTVWNMLLNAYGRAGDLDGAWASFNELLKTSARPDGYTYGTLIGMYANRGDVDQVNDLLLLAEQQGLKRTTAMHDGLVVANIKDENIEAAEDAAEEALTMQLPGSLTKMWNAILTARAFQRDLKATWRVFQRMKAAQVPLDGNSYAALLQAQAIKGQISSGEKILTHLMPRDGVKATAFHYAIVMGGYMTTGEVDRIFTVFNRMVEQGLTPSLSTNISILKAAAAADQNILQQRDGASDTAEATLERAEQLLEQVLSETDAAETATAGPRKGIGNQPLGEAYPSAYFEFLAFVYGQRRAFVKAQALCDQYIKLAGPQRSVRRGALPQKLLVALMITAYRRGAFDEVERCWLLITEKNKQLARKWKRVDTEQPGWVLRASRFSLSTPLSYYIKSLAEQEKATVMTEVVEKMLRDGYALDNTNWNLYIQLLARSGQRVPAMELCESKLMNGWKGWAYQRQQLGLPIYKSRRSNQGLVRPRYHTLVWLARAIMDMRSEELNLDVGERWLDHLAVACPRTMEAIQNMPTRPDEVQVGILGGRQD